MRLRLLFVAVVTLAATSLFSLTRTSAQARDPIWTGEYYNNAVLAEPTAFTRIDNDIAFDWGYGSPRNSIPDNEFSVRWTTDVYLGAGTYRFWVHADDHVDVTLDYSDTIIDTFAASEVGNLVSADVTLTTGTHHIQVDYQEINSEAFVYLDFENLADDPTGPDFGTPTNPPAVGAWIARYYTNANLAGSPTVIRGELQPGGDWGAQSPLPSVPVDNWSAQWNATLTLDAATYQIRVTADDGVRVYVDGVLVIDEWHIAAGEEYVVNRSLTAGNHSFTVDYYEEKGLASLDFELLQVSGIPSTNIVTVHTGRLNVRDAPNPVTGNILTQIVNGSTYPALTRTANNAWVKINANGVIGWVNTSYVSVTDLRGLPIEGSGVQPTGYQVRATPYAVNIRTGPGTQFRDIGNLELNDTALIVGRNANATWWQINDNDVVGWVSAQYAVIQSDPNLAQIPITG